MKLQLTPGPATMTIILLLFREIVHNYLAKNTITIIHHPPYSTELATGDLGQYRKMKMP